MSQKVDLKVDWCSYQAAKYAVEHWHYSKCIPVGKIAKLGVWEDKIFVGGVLFSLGNNLHIGKAFGLDKFDICELTRVALSKHKTPVTKIVSISIRYLKKRSPNLRAILSYADPEHNHHGGIYQGGNWIYLGESSRSIVYEIDGKRYHSRVANPNNKQFGRPTRRPKGIERANKIKTLPKHKYIYPLDRKMRKQIEPLAKPYPKRPAKEAA